MDLRELFSEDPPFSPAWVLIRVDWLPMGSATVAEMRGGQHFRDWDEEAYMRAALINAVRSLTHIVTLANWDPKKRKPDAPDPYPLPGQKAKSKEPKQGSFLSIAAQMIAATREKKRKAALCQEEQAEKK